MDPATEDLQRFWWQLSCRLDEGRRLLEALRAVERECNCPQVSRAVAAVADMVGEGGTLSEAMDAQPEFFGPGAVSIIRGGELLGMMVRAVQFVAEAAAQCPACVAWRGAGAWTERQDEDQEASGAEQ
jgi:type II secretory pathway component PulF